MFSLVSKLNFHRYNCRFLSDIRAFVENRFITIETKSSTKREHLKYPLIWLRDNCQCDKCFHETSSSRTIHWETFSFDDAKVKSFSIDNGLKLTWHDGHLSHFDIDWLKQRNFSAENRSNYLRSIYRLTPKLWSKHEFEQVFRKFDFGDVMSSDDALKSWIESLIVNGCALIENASLEESECRKLADRVGFIRRTHYGEEFIVRAKKDTSNVAYLSTPLQMHTDLPYYEYVPGVNLLHCIVQSKSEGAFNLLSDGFFVAEKLKREQPSIFKCLTETMVNWSDYGVENGYPFHSVYRAPVITLDREGNLSRINHSVPQRDSFFSIEVEKVDEWYKAMMKFVRLIHDESVPFKTKPGDILTFSNIRLLHGRTGYIDKDGNTRHLVGAYLDWDEIYSRLRCLTDSNNRK